MFNKLLRSGVLLILITGLFTSIKGSAAIDINSGFRGEFLNDLNATEKKFETLAEAIPADKYEWRPAEKVRSFGEIFVHMTQGNYYFASSWSGKPMEKITPPKATDKAALIAAMKPSFAALRAAALATTDADLDKTVGKDGKTERALMLKTLTHLHEHLGQLIAYSRMNGITPPWSAMNMPE